MGIHKLYHVTMRENRDMLDKSLNHENDLIIYADWDTDGATSAAMIYYSQYHKRKYPLEGKAEIYLRPSDARSLVEKLKNIGKCPAAMTILDIPLTRQLFQSLGKLNNICKETRLIYIDHHYSTIYLSKKLEKITEEVFIGHKPTAVLTFNLLRSLGIKTLTPRLRAFMTAVGVLERSPKDKIKVSRELVKLAASISKASNILKDEDIWRKLVKWLANPLPQDLPIDRRVLEEVKKIAEQSDRELKEITNELAFAARRVGYIKFVDARGKWRKQGASALASALYRKFRQPVALLVEKTDPSPRLLLIIRTRNKGAYKIAMGFLRDKLAEEIGGHGNIAIIRLREGIKLEEIETTLRKLSLRI